VAQKVSENVEGLKCKVFQIFANTTGTNVQSASISLEWSRDGSKPPYFSTRVTRIVSLITWTRFKWFITRILTFWTWVFPNWIYQQPLIVQ